MREKLTSYDNPSVGSGSIVNETQFAYNAFGQLTHDYQSHAGAVNTMTTPNVQYAYANGSANTIRPTALTYPDGRVLNSSYGTTDGIDDAASRVASLIDDDGTSHLADYAYLGMGTFVEQEATEAADRSGRSKAEGGSHVRWAKLAQTRQCRVGFRWVSCLDPPYGS
ncbi:MAG: hypothetical protein KF774_00130 [Planctomyces sp.]|nr:hypothetical protein [Planctomyces sp.]